ncbi:ATP-binding protein [Carboxylicivirga linearis]|uniref:ATP-binding protein n=2 Tax=Carboxylicivirga linearis TaxID=1628157 RepID=A0ABS5JYW0_9BACT|nr:ATP-binding protein [Carboxylicivirga linearis]MBS2100109.1 ATP-binding protein [Carboxylicivirga linearis]
MTGPESSGKTFLCDELSKHYKTCWKPEFAREYVENLTRNYTFKDVEIIARKQIDQYNEAIDEGQSIIFFDTFLIITKIWFTYVYNQCPMWLHRSIKNLKIDLYLLCSPDIPWIKDGVRENGHVREELFQLYKQELEYYGFNYAIVNGAEESRKKLAIQHINRILTQTEV